MIARLLRILWRVLILALGAAVLWLAIAYLIPYIDARLPLFVALLFAYCLFAYIVIPNLIRLFRLVVKPNHIPLYAVTSDGWPSDPINIAIVAKNKSSLVTAMKQAGWQLADQMTIKTWFRALHSFVFNAPYPRAPLSSLFLFDRRQDIGFEISTNRAKSMRTRHHVRFWQLREPRYKNDKQAHVSFWRQKLRHILKGKNNVWIGAATEDIYPLSVQWRTGQLSHGVSHEAYRERDFIIQTLRDAKLIKKVSTTDPGEEITFRGQEFRTIYITDGSIRVVEIKQEY